MEPLNKGHIGIRSTVPCSTVEPLNKGHVGIRSTVPCSTVEPLNKGHIGIRSTVPCSTVEPLNKGHIGIGSTIPCRKAVLISEVNFARWHIFSCPSCPYWSFYCSSSLSVLIYRKVFQNLFFYEFSSAKYFIVVIILYVRLATKIIAMLMVHMFPPFSIKQKGNKNYLKTFTHGNINRSNTPTILKCIFQISICFDCDVGRITATKRQVYDV